MCRQWQSILHETHHFYVFFSCTNDDHDSLYVHSQKKIMEFISPEMLRVPNLKVSLSRIQPLEALTVKTQRYAVRRRLGVRVSIARAKHHLMCITYAHIYGEVLRQVSDGEHQRLSNVQFNFRNSVNAIRYVRICHRSVSVRVNEMRNNKIR